MWMVDPRLMCIQHIIGEHGEIHKHRHNFVKRHSITGRITPVVQIEPLTMKKRHDELARFLKNHHSSYSLPDLSYLPENEVNAKVDVQASLKDLHARCSKCREKMNQ